jgi:transglutaminase-like putative cysteine protease
MNTRHHVAAIGGIVTMLGSLSLLSVFATWSWLLYATGAVIAIVGTAMLARTLRAPLWAQVLSMMAALTIVLTLFFSSGSALLGIIPMPATFQHFGELLGQAGTAIQSEAVPVPDNDGLLFMVALGIGGVAIIVDLCAVGLRRPALAGLALLAIYSVPVAVLPSSVSLFQFALGAAGFLWLLITDSVDRVRRFGRRFTGEGRDIDVWEPSPLAAAGRRLGVVGVVLAIVLPIATPGLETGLIDQLRGNGAGGSGVSSGSGVGGGGTVDLTGMLEGSLRRDRSYAMVRVTTDDPDPYYLRFGVADRASEKGFTTRNTNATANLPSAPDAVPDAAEGTKVEKHTATLEMVDFDMHLAPIYLDPLALQGLDRVWGWDPQFQTVGSRQASTKGRQYTVTYARRTYTAAALRRAGTFFTDEQETLTEVPAHQEVTDLVKRLTKDKNTEYDAVRALYDHFAPENGFTYALQTREGKSGNAIVDFLETKQGFCVQYAAALTWLVRAAGYPARVAFGFTRGGGAVNGQYTLTNFNLHAWTEVYFPNIGWVPFDATPSANVRGSVPRSWAPDLANPNFNGGQGSEGPDPRATASASAGPVDPGDKDPNAGGGAATGDSGPALWVWLTALAIVAVLAALAAPAIGRTLLRRRRRARHQQVITVDMGVGVRPATPVDVLTPHDPEGMAAARRDAHEAWAELLDTMTDFAIPVDPAETPRATAERLVERTGLGTDGQAAVATLARSEEFARYARRPLAPHGLDEAVRGARASFAARATRWERLSATFLPRSTIMRWRLRWLGASGATVARAGRWRDRLTLLSPRRLLTSRR